MILLLIVSIIVAILLHRREMNCHYMNAKDKSHKYPPKDSIILAGCLCIISVGIFLFTKKFPMIAIIPIAVFIAVLSVWIFEQETAQHIRAVCSLSLVPAALSAISKMILDDKTHAVSIGSIILSGILPIVICCFAAIIRYLYIEGYFMKQRSKAEIYAELRNIDQRSRKYKRLEAQLARLEKKASRKRSFDSRWAKFKTGYAPEEPLETPAEESEDVYEDIYSDSSLEPSDTGTSDGNKKFYYTVFGIAALIIAVCAAIVLINL